MTRAIQQRFSVTYTFPTVFTRGAFDPANEALADVFRAGGEKRHRVLVVVDADVLGANPDLHRSITAYGEGHRDLLEFVAAPFVVRGGEACKNDPVEVDKIRALVERHHLCRQSFVLVIGGGAVLDAAGYAVATAHRGLRLVRMPTTVLAQNDAGVGVKNGVNAFGRKNFVGTFSPPFAIVNDFAFLDTLPPRELLSGIAEAVKVALIKDREFFDFLYREQKNLAAFAPAAMEPMIIRCAELHIEHIGTNGDPFELGSARPLDFGHWSAHKLEELTGGTLRHGEAVAIGVALDSLYSHRTGRLSELELSKVLRTLEGIGFTLSHWALGWLDVDKSLREFQEHLGGDLTITLLDGIGSRVEVHEIDVALMRACIDELVGRHEGRKTRPGDRADAAPAGERRPQPGAAGTPAAD